MAQRRYFDYGSAIRSKGTAEGTAIAVGGIGVVQGFNKINSISDEGKTIVLTCDDVIDITNTSDGNIEGIKHGVITPDGILTVETDNLELSLQDKSVLTSGAYFVLATHQHIESKDTHLPTSYSLVKGDNSIIAELTKVDGTVNIRTWYTKLKAVQSEFNANTTVICALIDYTSTREYKIYTPEYNKWPSDTDKLRDELLGIMNSKLFKCYKTKNFQKINISGHGGYKIIFPTSINTEIPNNTPLLFSCILKFRDDPDNGQSTLRARNITALLYKGNSDKVYTPFFDKMYTVADVQLLSNNVQIHSGYMYDDNRTLIGEAVLIPLL